MHRPIRRLGVGLAFAMLVTAASACGGGDTQGVRTPELSEVEAQVAQLRLEVRTLRRELQTLRDASPTTTTLAADPTATTTTTAARG